MTGIRYSVEFLFGDALLAKCVVDAKDNKDARLKAIGKALGHGVAYDSVEWHHIDDDVEDTECGFWQFKWEKVE